MFSLKTFIQHATNEWITGMQDYNFSTIHHGIDEITRRRPTGCEITEIRKLPENNGGFFCQTCQSLSTIKTALREDQTNILFTQNSYPT